MGVPHDYLNYIATVLCYCAGRLTLFWGCTAAQHSTDRTELMDDDGRIVLSGRRQRLEMAALTIFAA